MRRAPAILACAILAAAALPVAAQEDGAALYAANCSACHGAEREGMGNAFPSLVDVGDRLEEAQIDTIIAQGRGLMPPFGHLSESERAAIVAYLTEGG